MEYREVQKIAKDTMEYIKAQIYSGMNLKEVRSLCEEKMFSLGADSFWYWDIGAFTFAGDETNVSVSGKEYITSDRIIADDDCNNRSKSAGGRYMGRLCSYSYN